MVSAPYARERHLAELAVLRASVLTKRIQSTVHEIFKTDLSPVTIADFAAQALVIGTLRHSFPNDEFLGEEDASSLRAIEDLRQSVWELVISATDVIDPHTGTVLPKPTSIENMMDMIDLGGSGKGGEKGRFWVVDPIDGTAAFLKGQQYAISLSLIENGEEVVGVLGCPNISGKMTQISEQNIDTNGFGIILSAIRGQGSNIRTMTSTSLQSSLPLRNFPPSKPNDIRIVDCAACPVTRHDVIADFTALHNSEYPNIEIWSSHIRYAALILGFGNVQFWIPATANSELHIWDHAGSQLIFTEIGGKVTDLDGRKVALGAGRSLGKNRGLVVALADKHEGILVDMTRLLRESN